MSENRALPRRRPLRLAALFLSPVLACAGCGVSAPASDPAEGGRALAAALDAWKGGATPETLAHQTPPIHVTDGDWLSGLRLQSYTADADGKLVGSDVNYNVVLELKTAQGKTVRRNAVYAVTTNPLRLVSRQDSL